MLYDPRKELGTKEHILAWLSEKEGRFCYLERDSCACGQYLMEYYGKIPMVWKGAIGELNFLAYFVAMKSDDATASFRTLYRAALKEWGFRKDRNGFVVSFNSRSTR